MMIEFVGWILSWKTILKRIRKSQALLIVKELKLLFSNLFYLIKTIYLMMI